jgi:hypothetical protein
VGDADRVKDRDMVEDRDRMGSRIETRWGKRQERQDGG